MEAPGMTAEEVERARVCAIENAGGEVLPDGVRVHGWTVRAVKTPIAGSAEREALCEALGGARDLPEMLFLSSLVLTHDASGDSVVFDAAAAPVRVAAAATWAASHEERGVAAAPADDSFDWTFTTKFAGRAVRGGGRAPLTGPGSAGEEGAAAELPFEPTEERVDRQELMRRDPILFYDDVVLYESELDDNGAMSCGVKVRVMPRCWYCLLRFWLRVDGVLVRLREHRLFCRTSARDAAGPARVVRESTCREETFEGLKARGAPHRPAQYPDADEAASVLLAAGGPVTVESSAVTLGAR